MILEVNLSKNPRKPKEGGKSSATKKPPDKSGGFLYF
jgi:hypothetical protein